MTQPSSKIQLLPVDDHGLFREGLAGILDKEPDFTVVGKYAVAAEALRDLEKCRPTVILLDFDLGWSGPWISFLLHDTEALRARY